MKTKRAKRKSITVRVMWGDKSLSDEAKRVVDEIKHVLNRLGYSYRIKMLPNRENSGGRVYFVLYVRCQHKFLY